MASRRVASGVLASCVWLWSVWCLPVADRTFVSFIATYPQQTALSSRCAVVRIVREKKVRGEGRKQIDARKAQVRAKKGAHFKDLLSDLSKAAYKGDIKGAEAIFATLTSLEGEFVVESGTVNKLILAAAHGGDISKAKHWFERLRRDFDLKPDVSIFTSMITAGAKYGDVEFAEEWFEAMRHYQISPDVASYGVVIQAASNARDLATAEKWFGKMEEHGLKANQITFNTVMSAAAKAADIDACEEWFQKMKDAHFVPTEIQFTTLIHAAKEAKNYEKAKDYFSTFRREGLHPTHIILSALIAAAANSGQPHEAARVLEQMKSFNVQPTRQSYSSVLNAWFKAKNTPKVLETMRRMQEAGHKCGVVDYTMAISALARDGGRQEDIEQLLREMVSKQTYPNAITRQRLKQGLGHQHYQKLSRELCLERRFDKITSQSQRNIAEHSRDASNFPQRVTSKASTRT